MGTPPSKRGHAPETDQSTGPRVPFSPLTTCQPVQAASELTGQAIGYLRPRRLRTGTCTAWLTVGRAGAELVPRGRGPLGLRELPGAQTRALGSTGGPETGRAVGGHVSKDKTMMHTQVRGSLCDGTPECFTEEMVVSAEYVVLGCSPLPPCDMC